MKHRFNIVLAVIAALTLTAGAFGAFQPAASLRSEPRATVVPPKTPANAPVVKKSKKKAKPKLVCKLVKKTVKTKHGKKLKKVKSCKRVTPKKRGGGHA